MTRYYKVIFTDCFQKKHETKVATDKNPAEDKRFAWADGFNGCRMISSTEISREEYRG